MARPIEHIREEKILSDFRDSFLEAASALPPGDEKRIRLEAAADHAERTFGAVRRINGLIEKAMGLTPSGDTDGDYVLVQAKAPCPRCKGEAQVSCITPNCPICPQPCPECNYI